MRVNLLNLFLVVFSVASLTPAQVSHQGMHGDRKQPMDQVGQVNFPTSCSPQVKKKINLAVAWLHSFEYEESERVFAEVAALDPKCGMAYWGIAMSNFHPLWVPPTPAELQKGSAAADKAKLLSASTQRERDYIDAIAIFFKDADRSDHRTRTFAYVDSMKRLSQASPTDSEAAIFYALALVTKGTMTRDGRYANEKEAAQILNRLLVRQPQHPGIAHYLIHGYDYPSLAELALPAARSYARIAPSSAHAQHMPSHIFTRLGLWQEAIKSNLDSHAAARAYALKHHLKDAWDEQLHAMDYLVYAYLQGAQDKKAMVVLSELNRIHRVDPLTFKVAYATAAIPARYALERRQWKEAANLPLYPAGMPNFPWEKFRWAGSYTHFARAIGAVRTSDVQSARKELSALTSAQSSLAAAKGEYDWTRDLEIKRQLVTAWIAYADGNSEEALRLMRAVADLDDSTEKHPVTPGTLLPAREQLGELLIELKKPAEALVEFEAALKQTPNRFNALLGAARAARQSNDQKKAAEYYRKLVEVSRFGESARPELDEARKFLRNGREVDK